MKQGKIERVQGYIKSLRQGHSELVSESQAIDTEILKQVQDDPATGKNDF